MVQIRRAVAAFAPYPSVFLSLHAQKNIPYLKKVTVLVKRQISPDGGRIQLEFSIKKLL